MKAILIRLFFLCGCLSMQAGGAGPIIISEQVHWIQGNTNADIDSSSSFDLLYPDDFGQFIFDEQSYGVWSYGSEEIRIDPAAGASVGGFSVSTFAVGTLQAGMTTYAHAKSTYIFKPTIETLYVAFSSPSTTAMWEGMAAFSFSNLTVPSVLEQWTSDPVSREGIDLFKAYEVNPSHEYSLVLECYSFGDSSTSGDLVNTIAVTIIPEPCMLLLLGIGIVLMRYQRQ